MHPCLLLLLQYAASQQVPLFSVTARSQLCKKCGSPLNPQTCSDVHITWLSKGSCKRLSKHLLAVGAASSGAVADTWRSGGKASYPKSGRQQNTVAAVRVCVVRSFHSMTLCTAVLLYCFSELRVCLSAVNDGQVCVLFSFIQAE
jgi:hypothetical protein